MKVVLSTLRPVVERWDDPGGQEYNGAGAPIRSRKYVEYVDGQIEVEFTASDLNLNSDDVQTVEEWLADNAKTIEHDVQGVIVKEWRVKKLDADGVHAVLEVQEFEDVGEWD